MSNYCLDRQRKRFTVVALLVLAAALVWFFSPGLPVLWGPWASAEERAAGKALFEHEWQPNDPLAGGDGLGPVFNARSCAACHFQGGIGGSGPNKRNVSTFEVHPTRADPNVRSGIIHAAATDPAYRESPALVRKLFPVVKGTTQVVEGCTVRIPDFDPLLTGSVNSTALFGAGWIDRISDKAIRHNLNKQMLANTAREFQLDFNTIGAGRPRVLPDGRIGKFGWKGQFATLQEFVAAACANELGLGNPLMEQARPLGKSDYPAVPPDLDHKQFTALVAFVDTLPRPVEVLPDDPAGREQAARGKELFHSIGCAQCHTPDLGGVKGVYSDFLLHVLEPPGSSAVYNTVEPPVPLPPDHPRPEEWKTPPLWGVADSAPYFHDGGSPTLEAAILRHKGDAASVTRAYQGLKKPDQQAVIAFLKTLRAPPPE
ncbi:MAG TPA: di-heme oxidoredictase family protein [Gemmataceae bacterium]|nr:di-heme oxidoredictase family protein [Gemmataceae bacterium]